MNQIDVSVVIPAYNAAATIGRALTALSSQKTRFAYEVIVVDDGSTDNTAEIVRSFDGVRYVHQSNQGPAAARNRGVSLAQGAYIAFTDSDCVPYEDWIERLVSAFEQTHAGVVAGSYGIANPESLLASGIHAEIIFRHTHLMPDYPKAFGSYNFCAKKNVFEKAGGFNASYRNASGEDNDLSYKILKSGERIYFERKALVAHHHQESIIRYLKEQFRHGLWRAKMYQDHPEMTKGDDYTFWKDILEVPVSALIFLGLFLSAFDLIAFKSVVCFLVLPFLLLQIAFAFFLMRDLFKTFFLGFVIFFRSFARTLGFSTGILIFFLKINRKKIK